MQSYLQLLDGYRRFRAGGWQSQRERWRELREGQSPQLMVIACSDSRVDPAQIFDVDPGQVFVVRNVAAMVPPFETTPGRHGVSAAVEFAVQFLKVRHIVIMGHGMCGGAKVALTRELHDAEPGEGGFIADWIRLLDEERDRVVAEYGDTGREAERAMEHAAVRLSLANLKSFPHVADKIAAGSLFVHGAFFAIADGILHILNQDTGHFEPVD